MTLNNVKLQYVWRNRKYLKGTESKDESGNKIPGTGKRIMGTKKAVMIAGINEEGRLVVGFSSCHKIDVFDIIGGKWTAILDKDKNICGTEYLGGKNVPGFGKKLAIKRADKWVDWKHCLISGVDPDIKEDDLLKDTVFVPVSIEKPLSKFIARCSSYYQNKRFPEKSHDFPEWVFGLDLAVTSLNMDL